MTDLLRALEALPPGDLVPSPDALQSLLDEAEAEAARRSQEVLAAWLPGIVPGVLGALDAGAADGDGEDAENEVAVTVFGGPPLLADEPLDRIERATHLAWGPGVGRARLVHPDSAMLLDASGEVGDGDREILDPRRAGHVAERLDEGWALELSDLLPVSRPLAALVEHLERATGRPVRHGALYGVGTALGPRPVAFETPRLLIQLAGRRQVLIADLDADQPQQIPCRPGTVVFVPGGRGVSHLPADDDTLHVELVVAPAEEEGESAELASRARQPARATLRLAEARALTRLEPDPGPAFRLAAPGGIVVLRDDRHPDDLTVGVGGHLLRTHPDAGPALVRLAAGQDTSAAELVDACPEVGDVEAWGRVLERLCLAGLVESPAAVRGVGQAVRGALPNIARIGHVSALDDAAVEQAVTALADAPWSPDGGRVPRATGDPSSVETVVVDPRAAPELVRSLLAAVRVINAQLFGFEITGLSPDDPILAVRHRGHPEADPEAWTPADLGGELDDDHSTRKLLFVLPLRAGPDEEGGRVRLPAGSDTIGSEAGTVSVFGAFRPWVLSPLRTGERLTVVGRVHGPAFR